MRARHCMLIVFVLLLALGTGAVLAQGGPPFPPGPGPFPWNPPVGYPFPDPLPWHPGDGIPFPGSWPWNPGDHGQQPHHPYHPHRPHKPTQPTTYVTATCSPEPRLENETYGEVAQSYSSLRRGIGSADVILTMPGGAVFEILDGPICAGPHYWYQVTYNGLAGWVTEGVGNEYWLEPVYLD